MQKFFAEIISTILNPIFLLIPVPYFLVLKSTNNYELSFFWEVVSLIFILVFSIFILIGVEKKMFSDLDISKRKQRPLLFTFAIGLAAIYTVFLYFLSAPKILFIGIFTLILGLVVFELVNRTTKASIHVGTVSAFATSLFIVYDGIFALSFLLIPLVAWARIANRNHTKQQTVIGAALGILITLVSYVIFRYIV
ncbi:MAG: hypothetical protein M1365_03325 [Actinobacteria bacterium]|nr:hypothetical protein [Actinomycetota bacterium]